MADTHHFNFFNTRRALPKFSAGFSTPTPECFYPRETFTLCIIRFNQQNHTRSRLMIGWYVWQVRKYSDTHERGRVVPRGENDKGVEQVKCLCTYADTIKTTNQSFFSLLPGRNNIENIVRE